MQTTIFRKLYTLTFTHVRPKVTDSIKLTPDANTIKLFKNYKLLFKQKENVVYIAQTIVGSKPLVEIESNLTFRFFIDFDYRNLVHGSNIDLYNAKDSSIYIKLNGTGQSSIFQVDNNCIIPKLKELNDNKILINSLTNEETLVNEITDGVYSLPNSPNNYQAYFVLTNHNKKGFLDIECLPNDENADLGNEVSINFADREVFVEYHIFDRNDTYKNYIIESEIAGLQFIYVESDNGVVMRSNSKLTMAEIEKAKFALLAERNNGRQITLKEKMQVPTAETLYKLEDNSELYVKSFFYV